MTNNPEPPIFVYILQRINNKYDVITKNRDIPKETIMANLRAGHFAFCTPGVPSLSS